MAKPTRNFDLALPEHQQQCGESRQLWRCSPASATSWRSRGSTAASPQRWSVRAGRPSSARVKAWPRPPSASICTSSTTATSTARVTLAISTVQAACRAPGTVLRSWPVSKGYSTSSQGCASAIRGGWPVRTRQEFCLCALNDVHVKAHENERWHHFSGSTQPVSSMNCIFMLTRLYPDDGPSVGATWIDVLFKTLLVTDG